MIVRRRHTVVAAWLAFLFACASMPAAVLAAAPDVRELDPATVAVDGSIADWEAPFGAGNPNYLADMFQAGKPEKPVLATAYGQYDCGTGTMYVMVRTEPGWQIVPNGGDNYVKIGQTDKRVDGNSGNDGTPPDFEYFPQLVGWEASFQIPPGAYTGDDGALNIHAQVLPRFVLTGETAAVENRRLDVVIDCSDVPTPTPSPTADSPTPIPTPSPTPSPTASPTPSPSPTPTTGPTPTPAPSPTASPTPSPTASPTASPTPTPSPTPLPTQTSAPTPTQTIPPEPTPEPPVRPLIVAKINDQGTPEFDDDVLLPGATFEFRLDNGNGIYEPDTADAPVLETIVAEEGFAVFHPPAPGSYWVTESSAPEGFDTAEPILVPFSAAQAQQNCSVIGTIVTCVPDDDLSGGFVLTFVSDSPTGGALPTTGEITPPATDVADSRPAPRVPSLLVILGVLVSIAAGALLLRPRRDRGR